MGMFDDLVAQHAPNKKPSGGMFGDLIEKHAPASQIDYNRPADVVRADVGKLDPQYREDALKRWADTTVAKEQKDGGFLQAADDTARTISRGTFVGPVLDEITAAGNKALQVATGGFAGADYDETLAYQRARDRYVDTNAPVLSFAGKIAGGIAGGVGAARTAAGSALAPAAVAVGGPLAAITPAATAGGRIAQGAGVGAGFGAVAGFGDAEGGLVRRAEGALVGAGVGATLGAGIATGANAIGAVRQASARHGPTGAAAQLAESLPGTVDDFADEVAVGAMQNSRAVQRRTLDVLGEEMERFGGDRAQALPATVARIQQETGVTAATAQDNIRNLTRVHADSPLMLGEYPSVSASNAAQRNMRPGNVDLDDLGRVQESQSQGLIDYLANSGNSPSATAVRNAINGRQETIAPYVADTAARFGPQIATGARTTRPALIEDATDMVDQARQLGSTAYNQAYGAPVNNQLMLNTLPRLLAFHEGRAATRSGEAADAIKRAVGQFYLEPQPGQRLAMGTLRQLQDARTAVRGQMDAYARSGRNDLAGAVRPIYQQMTSLMERMSPQWGAANRQWRDMNFLDQARELGDAFAGRAGPRFREQLAEFQQMAPEAQNIVRTHFLQQLYDKLDNLGDTNSVSRLFANDHSRNMIRQLFGEKAAIQFTRAVRDAKVAEASRAGLGNSRTHIRGQVQRQMDADTGILAAAETVNAQGLRNWLMERATQLFTERRNQPLAAMVTTPMRDTAAVAQRITQMRNAQARLQRYQQPSRYTLPVIGAVGNQVGSASSPRGMAAGVPSR